MLYGVWIIFRSTVRCIKYRILNVLLEFTPNCAETFVWLFFLSDSICLYSLHVWCRPSSFWTVDMCYHIINAVRLWMCVWVCDDTWGYQLWSVFSCCCLTDVSSQEHTLRPHISMSYLGGCLVYLCKCVWVCDD